MPCISGFELSSPPDRTEKTSLNILASASGPVSPKYRAFTMGDLLGHEAEAYSPGNTILYPETEIGLFPFWPIGGGVRAEVFGTARYGSGYPHGYGDNETHIAERPLPFGFWPLTWGTRYDPDPDYGLFNSTARPGDVVSVALITPPAPSSPPNRTNAMNGSFNEVYRILGDASSVDSVAKALKWNCSAVVTPSSPFFPSNRTWPLPTQIIQYYRASSFALSLDGYDNPSNSYYNMTATTIMNETISISADPPIPYYRLNSTFLACVNATIGAAVPLIAPPNDHSGFDTFWLLWIIPGVSLLMAFVVSMTILGCYARMEKRETLTHPVQPMTGWLVTFPQRPTKPASTVNSTVGSDSQTLLFRQNSGDIFKSHHNGETEVWGQIQRNLRGTAPL